MLLWDTVASFVGENTNVLGSLAQGVAAIASATISANANDEAARIASEGLQAQADAIVAGMKRSAYFTCMIGATAAISNYLWKGQKNAIQ